jgi:hypothetical protein
MTEPQTPEPKPTEPNTPDPKPADPAPAGEDKDSLRRALTQQATEKDARNAATQKELDSYKSKELAAKEKQMIDDGKQNDLITDLRKQNEDLKAVGVMDKRAILVASTDAKLAAAGMNHERMRRGTLVDLPTDATAETIDAWVAEMKGRNPEDFTSPATPMNLSDAGDPDTNAGGADLESRLKSDDKKIKKAANEEQLRNKLTGITQR